MERFLSLVERFQALSEKFGYGKSSSYSVSLDIANNCYELEGKYSLELGTYDIGDLPRHSHLGPFKNLDELCDKFETIVQLGEQLT